jgi:uracil-DNA glycosylase family 4
VAGAAGTQASPVLWSVGEALALYADTTTGIGPRWLVLAETSAAALHAGTFEPFEGDAGKLLDNMLRAARLHQAGTVLLAPLVRRTQAEAVSANLAEALPGLLAGAQADVVLVMGRLAAQALLQSNEPFGKLRGRVHELQGLRCIVTHDAAYLLRTQADKAKAWEDLCLAISTASGRPG